MYEDLIKRLRTHNGWALNKTLDEAADAIEELQDRIAASEATIKRQSDIIQAKDRDLQRAIDAKSQWIPVTERLPEDMVDVLCYYEYFRYGNYNRMFRTIDRGHVFKGRWFGEAGEGHKNKVFAWMPLPEPPKEE